MWVHRGKNSAPTLSTRYQESLLFPLFTAALIFVALQVSSAQAQSVDLTSPDQHFTVQQPRVLDAKEALAVYQNVRARMFSGYSGARNPAIADLDQWPVYNSAPYRSATHGQRYVNNYANPMARAYGRYEASGPMPVGAVLAKDSFTVTGKGDVFAGALFLMEKMPAGFNQASHDWKYTMIMPDGSLFGTTKGDGSKRVAFCITCHEAVAEKHHQMFFVPEEYRVEVLNSQ